MNSFVEAVRNVPVETRGENGMRAFESTMRYTTDLFGKVGSARGHDLSYTFEMAYQEDADLALRVALWTRDVRGGAGERKMFRDFLLHLAKMHPEVLINTNFLSKVPEVGRWDDLLVFIGSECDTAILKKAFGLIQDALDAGNGLCAKWMPRKGVNAAILRSHMKMTPKSYRKLLVRLTEVVETPMCAKEFDSIEYSKVPSLAMTRYMKAFTKNDTERFKEYRENLKDGTATINAGAVYPYDIVKALLKDADHVVCSEQWKALPNYMTDAKVLPMVDVSGSMESVSVSGSLTAMHIALSLGLYCSDKNTGPFKDMFLTFTSKPKLQIVKGDLHEKLIQMYTADWGGSTNLHGAIELVLDKALKGNVAAEDMPTILLVLSDMQFNHCAEYDDMAIEMISRKYKEAGYTMPAVVFWNLDNRVRGNAPVSFDKKGVCLVSGFSPAIMKSILAADLKEMSAESVMRATVCVDRYNYA